MEFDVSVNKKRMFVSPLDWGLGHASRLVPIISELRKQGHFILLGTEPKTAAFLKEIFPDILHIQLKGYGIKYGKNKIHWKLLLQIPQIKLAILREHFHLRKIVKEYQIDTVISDSRFGLWHKKTQNIIVSHQLQILYPQKMWVYGKLLNLTNRLLLNRFDVCLIPDDENHRFSGLLSQNKAINTQQFIGLLSRFSLQNKNSTTIQNYDLVFVFSGPEPQRTIFEENVINQLKNTLYSALLISGQPEKNYSQQLTANIKKVSHLSDNEFAVTLQQANIVFSRSGYSSLMDYAALGLKQIVLIPTKGQTEQEYLAEKFSNDNRCFAIEQEIFSLQEAIENVKSYSGFNPKESVFFEENASELLNFR